MTGRMIDRIIVDDPINEALAMTPEDLVRAKVNVGAFFDPRSEVSRAALRMSGKPDVDFYRPTPMMLTNMEPESEPKTLTRAQFEYLLRSAVRGR